MAVSEIIVNPNGGGTPCYVGEFDISSGQLTADENVGFEPKQIAVVFQGSGGSATSVSNGAIRFIYDERVSKTHFHRGIKTGAGNMSTDTVDMVSSLAGFTQVNANGFKFAIPSNTQGVSYFYGKYRYFAIG